jgi:IS30 family transposase
VPGSRRWMSTLSDWDQGVEMRDWKHVRMATDMAIYSCDPHAPWQRGTNENGLLRRYFPRALTYR